MDYLVVWGNGGHARVIEDMFGGNRFVPDGNCYDGYIPVEYRVFDLATVKPEDAGRFNLMGFGDLAARLKLAEILRKAGWYPSMKHTAATVAKYSTVEHGTVVLAGAAVNIGAKVGRHCIVNTNAVVEHDCEVGDCSHVAPGAVLLGGVKVGKGVLVGANATVLPRVTIGDGAVIGAGAVVCEDVPAGEKWTGWAARRV